MLSTLRGVWHFLFDRTPGGLPVAQPTRRLVTPYSRDGTALVSMVRATDDMLDAIQRAASLLGGLEKTIASGDRVVVKPNYNSADPFPASTDVQFLRAVVQMLVDGGARVTVGESSGGLWRPTRKVLKRAGVFEALAGTGVEVVAFEDQRRDWVKVRVGGEYLRTVTIPRIVHEADRLVYVPCMKTHRYARFSLALKLAVGIMHPGERRALHMRYLEYKVPEISLARQPDLIIMDGRKAFISGGPEKGEVIEPGIVMASGDIVAVDVEALKVLGSYGGRNRLLSHPYDSPQISVAIRHRLGLEEYEVVR